MGFVRSEIMALIFGAAPCTTSGAGIPSRLVSLADGAGSSSRVEFTNRSGFALGLSSKQELEIGRCGRGITGRRASFKILSVAHNANIASGTRVGQFKDNIPEVGSAEAGPEEEETQGAEGDSQVEEDGDQELEMGFKMSRVCDRLIEVFMIEKRTPVEWRKLLAFSEEWTKIRPHFFNRCQTNAKAEEDPKKRGDLLKLARKLKQVDDDMMRHDDLLAEVEMSPLNLDIIVAKRRKDFTSDFFEHLHTLCDASYKNLNRRDEIAAIAGKCLSAIQAHDRAQEDDEALADAQLKFDDILNSPSLEAAANKIDQLAKRQELDSTLMLLITKAWAAAKESSMMKDEVKDIMFHLYNVARGNMQRLVPREVRIIRHLLAIRDPRERFAAMTDAFSPGDELEGKNEDMLYTTPEDLHKWVKVVLDAYHTNKQGTLIKEARNLMNPEVIGRLQVLLEILEDQFL